MQLENCIVIGFLITYVGWLICFILGDLLSLDILIVLSTGILGLYMVVLLLLFMFCTNIEPVEAPAEEEFSIRGDDYVDYESYFCEP